METTETLEPQQNKANPQLKQKPWLFTSAQAKVLAVKSHEARRFKDEQDKADKAKLEAEAERARLIILADAMSKKEPTALQPEESYRTEQLARTRTALESLYNDFEESSDAKERKFLSD